MQLSGTKEFMPVWIYILALYWLSDSQNGKFLSEVEINCFARLTIALLGESYTLLMVVGSVSLFQLLKYRVSWLADDIKKGVLLAGIAEGRILSRGKSSSRFFW